MQGMAKIIISCSSFKQGAEDLHSSFNESRFIHMHSPPVFELHLAKRK